ncbi:MAG: lytic murein transglycosylase [Gammaproteobacteria bacterium]|nr:lytic murein transglycosylase [Gammaproteobacteria bacterium]
MRLLLSVLIAGVLASCALHGKPLSSEPTEAGFAAWVKDFRKQAKRDGVSKQILNTAFSNVQLNQDVLKRDAYQPEFVKPVWAYLDTAVSSTRVKNGRSKYQQHRALLEKVAAEYQVAPSLLVAIWGLETAYGATFGGFNVVESLATLGYAGRRAAFWEQQLLAALQIIDNGDIAASQMIGSWAGAMGHTQFMPTSFQERAVDYDGDGRRDIWGSFGDVFASTANFMQRAKWQNGESWGAPVQLPRNFDWALADSSVKKSVADWRALGVKGLSGRALPQTAGEASILLPAGHRGPAFIVLPNFNAIKRYNNSTAYALAIGLLSDRVAGASAQALNWPKNAVPLNRAQYKEMQTLLTQQGFDTKGIDGIFGANSRKALRAWQLQTGIVPDAFATMQQLERLRQTR